MKTDQKGYKRIRLKPKKNRLIWMFLIVGMIPYYLTVAVFFWPDIRNLPFFRLMVFILSLPASFMYYFHVIQKPSWLSFNMFLNMFLLAYILYNKYEILLCGKYSICPNCNKSILVYERWQCEHCDNFQNKERYIFDKCQICGRFVDIFCCEHCHKEIRIR